VKQDLFNSIASGNLPMLAEVAFDGKGNPDVATVVDAIPTYPDQGVGNVQWTALLAHIAHIATLCAQPHTAQFLRTLSVRRPRTVVIDLAREYVFAWNVAYSNGLVLSATEVFRITRNLPVNNELADEFFALAETYQRLLYAMAPRNGDALFRWLSERASVHVAQAQAVQPAI
jgi:hypothetical protein